MAVLALARAVPAASAQQFTAAAPLVFDGVTVVDVEQGKLVPDQRVVIVGNRIRDIGGTGAVKLPPGARVVDARGKYLIPGLWDMHVHPLNQTEIFYPLFIAYGITGIRDAGSFVALDSLRQWRREILAGARVGPPRQLLSGPPINSVPDGECVREHNDPPGDISHYYTCVSPNIADARRVVDSLREAGVDMIKTYSMDRATYLPIISAARQAGVPVGGHLDWTGVNPLEASDSGVGIIDHEAGRMMKKVFNCWGSMNREMSMEKCRPLAERFQHNNTWWVPTLLIPSGAQKFGPRSRSVYARFNEQVAQLWGDSVREFDAPAADSGSATDSLGYAYVAQHVGLPILAGSDVNAPLLHKLPPGISLHAELAVCGAEGLTSLEALRTATLNPAKFLRATDSLGTVAAGKLADLVLLDANPLADITNTTTIQAVVANGRYYDRAALDDLLAGARAKAKQIP